MNKILLSLASVAFLLSSQAHADNADYVTCLPMAKATWEAVQAVFDDQLSGKPKYEAVKADPSGLLATMATDAASKKDGATACGMGIALLGHDGMKAMMVKEFRADKAAGKRLHMFD